MATATTTARRFGSFQRHVAFSSPSPLPIGTSNRLFSADAGPRLTVRSFAPRAKRPRPKKTWVCTDDSVVPPRDIGVIGGGLAGLSISYHLLHSTRRMARKRGYNHEEITITIYDPCADGTGGATSVAAGLLHPFTPRVKKKIWHAKKALPAVTTLINTLEDAYDMRGGLLRRTGLLRMASTQQLKLDFETAARRFPKEVICLTPEEMNMKCSLVPDNTYGCFLPNAMLVNVPKYTEVLLREIFKSRRCEIVPENIRSLADISRKHDATVVACGAGVRNISELSDKNIFPVKPCRGQNIHYKPRNSNAIIPDFPIISGKYIIPEWDRSGIVAGATFEYTDPHDTPILQDAVDELEETIQEKLLPSLKHFWRAETASAGIRSLPPRSSVGSIPLAGKIHISSRKNDGNIWYLNGLGSRGLIHSSYLGKLVAQAVVAGNEKLIPLDARRANVALDLEDLQTDTDNLQLKPQVLEKQEILQ